MYCPHSLPMSKLIFRVWCGGLPFIYFVFGSWNRSVFRGYEALYELLYSVCVVVSVVVILITFIGLSFYMVNDLTNEINTFFWISWLFAVVVSVWMHWGVVLLVLILFFFSYVSVLWHIIEEAADNIENANNNINNRNENK